MPLGNDKNLFGKQNTNSNNGHRTVVLFGDSIVEQYNNTSGNGTIAHSNGIATYTLSGHGRAVGDIVKFNGATDPYFNIRAKVLSTTSTTLTFEVYPGASPTATGVYMVYPESITGRNWFAEINRLLDSRFKVIQNSGVGGDDTDQMLRRIGSDVLDLNPTECWMSHGTNDIYKSSFSTDKIKANDLKIWSILKSAGILIRETSIIPRTTTTTAQRQQALEINRFRKEYWANNSGGIYIDTYSPLVNSLTGVVKTNVLSDGVHPSQLGGYLVASSAYPTIGTPQPSNSGLTSSILDTWFSDNSNRQIFDNPVMGVGSVVNGTTLAVGTMNNAAGGAVPTGVVADVCKVTVDTGAGTTVACSIVPRTKIDDGDDFGNNQQLVIASTANLDQVTFSTNQSLITRIINGDIVQFEVSVKVTNATNLRSVRLTGLTQTSISGNLIASDGAHLTADAPYPNGTTFIKTFRTAPIQIRTPSSIHGALSNMNASVVFGFAGAGGATVSIAKLGIIKL